MRFHLGTLTGRGAVTPPRRHRSSPASSAYQRPQYWDHQYPRINGHQPGVQPAVRRQACSQAGGYGSGRWSRQASANTFKATKPDGKTFTVTGVRPVSVPGPWVITKIA